jgi:hypothetical protein
MRNRATRLSVLIWCSWVLFASTARAGSDQWWADSNVIRGGKPYELSALLKAVRLCLDGGKLPRFQVCPPKPEAAAMV